MDAFQTYALRILVVDDEEDVCLLIRRFLTRAGCEVSCAHNLQDARRQLETCRPDILLLDNNLPDGTGLAALPELHADCPDTRIYLVSAMELRDSALSSGATGFIEKPVDLHRLAELISAARAA